MRAAFLILALFPALAGACATCTDCESRTLAAGATYDIVTPATLGQALVWDGQINSDQPFTLFIDGAFIGTYSCWYQTENILSVQTIIVSIRCGTRCNLQYKFGAASANQLTIATSTLKGDWIRTSLCDALTCCCPQLISVASGGAYMVVNTRECFGTQTLIPAGAVVPTQWTKGTTSLLFSDSSISITYGTCAYNFARVSSGGDNKTLIIIVVSVGAGVFAVMNMVLCYCIYRSRKQVSQVADTAGC